jgi:GxxExxY protein
MTRMDELHEYVGKRDGGEIIYRELSYQIMQAVFEVHNTLGPGFIENVYEEALAHELALRHISFERQKQVAVRYKDKTVGIHRLDLVIEDKIILELKAVAQLTDTFKQQTLSYIKATDLKLGILINFGCPKVQYIRIVN